MFSWYPAQDDFSLLTTELTLGRDSRQGAVAIQAPRDGLDGDAPFESFVLELGDPLGLAPPNVVLKNTVITIEDVGELCTKPFVHNLTLQVW